MNETTKSRWQIYKFIYILILKDSIFRRKLLWAFKNLWEKEVLNLCKNEEELFELGGQQDWVQFNKRQNPKGEEEQKIGTWFVEKLRRDLRLDLEDERGSKLYHQVDL